MPASIGQHRDQRHKKLKKHIADMSAANMSRDLPVSPTLCRSAWGIIAAR
jgi:hypothetical protein